jgi:serine/threonine protein kinase
MDERFALEGYVIDELIGFGGTGEVWRAHDAQTGETVALKRLRTRGEAATERLRREGALLASVAGPHVIGVRRLVVEGDEAVLVMDHAAGGSLATVIGVRGQIPAPEAVTILAPIAAALAAAHARDLVHGDLTPANILFTADGRPLLADFGLARALGATPQLIEGTADYVDPHVVAGGPLTAASDIFALGVVGYTVLAGRSPWGSGPPESILDRSARGERPLLAAVAPETPAALIVAVEAMLSADPYDRPDARSVANSVLRACAAAPVGLVHTIAPIPPPMTDQVRPSVVLGETDELLLDELSSDLAVGPRSALGRRVLIGAAAIVALVGAALIGIGSEHLGHRRATPVSLAGDPSTPVAVTSSRSISGAQAGAAASPSALPTVDPRAATRIARVATSATATVSHSPAAPRSAVSSVRRPPGPRRSRPLDRTSSAAGRSGVDERDRAPSVAPSVARTPLVAARPASWLGLVSHLDALRASAFAEGQVAPLASVYAPGVSAYAADLTTVRSLASRGLRARGFAATVERVTVERRTPTTERLRVTDRLSAYTLVDAAGTVEGRGAARPARAFTMELSGLGDRWRVTAITPT